MIKGYYPPRDIEGYLVDNLSDLPKESLLIDYNEFYRLFKKKRTHYIYKIKKPKSPLSNLMSKILD